MVSGSERKIRLFCLLGSVPGRNVVADARSLQSRPHWLRIPRDTACEVAPLLGKLADLCVALPALLRVRFSGEVAGRVDVENAPLFGVELSELCQSVWCHRFPKVGLVVDCTSHLVLASVPMWGPSPDVEHWKKALRETLKNIRPKVLLADAGYDSEESHRFAREEHGIRTIIPNRVGRPTKKLPRGKYRKQKH
jgi:hypothetical protein